MRLRLAVCVSSSAILIMAVVTSMSSDMRSDGVGVTRVASAADSQESAIMPDPVVELHDLMELFNRPLYMQMKASLAEMPNDDKGWSDIEHRGWQVAEVANLVALHRDHDVSEGTWAGLTKDLQKAGVYLAEAGKAKDFARAQSAYRGVVQRCNICHRKVAPDEAPVLKP